MSGASIAPRSRGSRGIFLTTMALLLVLLAISDFAKGIEHANHLGHGGLVVFGHRLETTLANSVFGALFGSIFLIYAWGIWNMRRWVVPLAVVYAFYVPANMVLFWSTHGDDPDGSLRFVVVFLAIALTGSVGTGLHLCYHHDTLASPRRSLASRGASAKS